MNKRYFGILMAVVLLISAFAGCGARTGNTSADYPAAPQEEARNDIMTTYSLAAERAADGSGLADQKGGEAYKGNEPVNASQVPKTASVADSLAGTGNTIDNVSNAILAERKIIRSANLNIEVENFDEARNNINSIISGIGIVQESNVVTDRVYVDGNLKLIKNGTLLLRVYKEKFDSVFNNLKGIGDVTNESITGQDVTDRFVDTESRLRILKLEQSRLEVYLAKLEDLDKIFRTESRLTEIRQEIESLTGNLNKMNSLVELSTITITMNEKNPNVIKNPNELSYGEKLLDNLKSSLEGVVTFLGELLIIVVAAIPVLILLGLFVLLGLFIYRRIPQKRKETVNAIKKESEEENK